MFEKKLNNILLDFGSNFIENSFLTIEGGFGYNKSKKSHGSTVTTLCNT